MTSDWMDTKEAAEYAEMHPETLTRLARNKKIQHGFDGRKYRWLREHIDDYFMTNGFDGARR